MAIALADRLESRRIIIDCTDGSEIREPEVAWCDVYGKTNYSDLSIREDIRRKVVPIGPSFGIRVWNPLASAFLAGRSLLQAYPRIVSLKEHVANYRRQYRYRLPHSRYQQENRSRADFVFHMSRLWGTDPMTNANRGLFVDACRALKDVTFEGGFVPADANSKPTGFEDKMLQRTYSMSEWLSKTEESCLVFNTPAVYQCHGWKLGEYLALGKAIVSTPLSRDMPAPLTHGVHIHFVEPELRSMKMAVERIVHDAVYRRSLERNARAYYDEFLCPRAVVRRLVQKAGIEV